jgi:hypothetical protein
MQLRVFGRTGMQRSVLDFGCGAVGGFRVRGDPADQERNIARRSPRVSITSNRKRFLATFWGGYPSGNPVSLRSPGNSASATWGG